MPGKADMVVGALKPTSVDAAVFGIVGKERLGRPPKDSWKVHVTSRYDADIIERFRVKGGGWQSPMNHALRTYLMKHEL